jgi:hypothetical protein
MKLRIKGNSLRLRVSRSELERFLQGERVDEMIHFTADSGAYLTYALQFTSQAASVRVQYEPHSMTVLVSEEQAKLWGEENEVGIYTSIDIGNAGLLEVIIEKDFACLDRSDEENADAFANPHAGSVC